MRISSSFLAFIFLGIAAAGFIPKLTFRNSHNGRAAIGEHPSGPPSGTQPPPIGPPPSSLPSPPPLSPPSGIPGPIDAPLARRGGANRPPDNYDLPKSTGSLPPPPPNGTPNGIPPYGTPKPNKAPPTVVRRDDYTTISSTSETDPMTTLQSSTDWRN